MKTATIPFKSGTVIELALATVIDGKEAQLFGDYFPKVTPIVAELGGKPLGSFAVTDSASSIGVPKMGSFFQWPSADGFHKLHGDQRFLDTRHIRDDALSFFSNAHFFTVIEDTGVTFSEGTPYGLIASSRPSAVDALKGVRPLVHMTAMSVTSDWSFNPTHIQIADWHESIEALLQEPGGDCEPSLEVFKIVPNMPA